MDLTDVTLQDFVNEARAELKRFRVVGIAVTIDPEREDSVFPVLVTSSADETLSQLKEAIVNGYRPVGLLACDPIWADNEPSGYYIRPFSMGLGAYKHLVSLLAQHIELRDEWRVIEDRKREGE